MTEAESPNVLKRFRSHLIEWNVFTSDDQHDPRLLREQRIATRVYVICMTTSLLILLTLTLLNSQTEIKTIYNPSVETYKQLQNDYSTSLTCPCSTSTMPYKNFIIIETVMHQICSSDFVSQEWINAFHIPDAGRYGAIDFRTTANAQFKVLQTLCTLARNYIHDSLFDLNHTQLLTANVLTEKEIFIQTKINGEKIRTNTLIQMNNALKLVQLSIRTNRISTELNTNHIIGVNIFINGTIFAWYFAHTSWYWTVNNKTTYCHCDRSTCSFPAGFYSFYDISDFNNHTVMVPQNNNASYMVPGFVGSCTPLEAVLQATFVCLYDVGCITNLSQYFPRLAELIPTINVLNVSASSKYPLDVNVSYLVKELFLEQMNISINYDRYYTECAPKICTYSYTKQATFVYVITFLIGLYGGLRIILPFVILLIVKFFIRKQSDNHENVTTVTRIETISMRKKITNLLTAFLRAIKSIFINLNLFQSSDRSPEAIRHQRLSTKMFLCLLIGSLFILLLFTTISEQTTSKTYQRPSYTNYEQLYKEYSDKLICPCTEITPTYSSFINVTPIYHPVCSSAFVKQIWFDQLIITKPTWVFMTDWRIASLGYFQSLAELCKLAYNTVNNGFEEFKTRTIVTTRLVNEDLFHKEMNDTLEELIRSMHTEYERVNNIFRLLLQVDQYFTGLARNGHIKALNQTSDGYIKARFYFHGHTYQGDRRKCIFAFHPDCEESMSIIHNRTIDINVPGFVWRSTIMDSILQSTLECLYSNTDCLTNILFHYLNYTTTVIPVPPLDVSQLIRTFNTSKVLTLADNLFVEEWKSTISYKDYFQTCAPSSCQYIYVQRANYFYIVTMFLAVYGGLIFLLRLLVPLAVKLALRNRQPEVAPTNHQNLEGRISRTARFRAFCWQLLRDTRTKIIDLNFFQTYSFGENIDPITALRLGRLTTRLYLCLYVICLTVLILYTSIHQRTLRTNIHNPSLAIAQQLQEKYIVTVECPCTRASIPIDEFVSIQPYFHPICNSVFATDEWREALTFGLDDMFEELPIGDYRPYLSAHLQLLSGLCQHAIKHVNDTIRSFTSMSFVTNRLLSQSSFDAQLSNLLYQTEARIPTIFTRALELVQATNHDNAFMTIYGGNYEHIIHPNRSSRSAILYSQAISFYNSTNCSCGLHRNCVKQATFIWPNYTTVKGLFIGCLPSQSFFASTLECFFDVDCINLIRSNMPGNMNQTHGHSLNASDMLHSQYKINTTVGEIVAKLFMEEWSTKIYYDRYFTQCAPNICSYSYVDNANPLYVITTLLGLYGGLTVVLSWWSPQLVKLARRIQIHCRQRHQTRVTPFVT